MKKHGRMQRTFEGRPVVDAKRELRVFVNDEDIRTAIRKDPAHCAYSNACRRMFGSHAVVFYRSIAYVELPDGRGSGGTRIERFNLRKNTRNLIAEFDRTGHATPDGYSLIPPSPGFTLDHRQVKGEEYRLSHPPRDYSKKKRKKVSDDSDVRLGTGVVRFITVKKSLKMS